MSKGQLKEAPIVVESDSEFVDTIGQTEFHNAKSLYISYSANSGERKLQ